MRRLYTLLLWLLMPAILLRLVWRSLWLPAYRQRWQERFGLFDGRPAPGGIWIHAVSVGETQAIEPLVRALRKGYPATPILFTTTTPTGSERAHALFGDDIFHVYFPYDLPWCIHNFLDRTRPRALLMVETEIWPNLLHECQKRQIPTLLGNGRMSLKSARGYQKLGNFTRETFSAITQLAVQTAADAERFIRLGVPAARVHVTGSIKFDMKVPASVLEQTQVVRRMFGEGRPVWVAASTHEGEEELVLSAHKAILARTPNALLVLVPRHPERFDRVANLLQRLKIQYQRRSAGQGCRADTQVLLGDTMGELTLLLGSADAAFIGGSLIKIGGHNMLEAAAQGVPVCFGRYVFNFQAIAALLQQQDAAVQIEDAEELGQLMGSWLTDASERSRIGENGRRVVTANRGALDRLMKILRPMI